MRVWVLEVPVDEAKDRAQPKAKGSLWAAVAAATAAVVSLLAQATSSHKGEFNLLRVHLQLEG